MTVYNNEYTIFRIYSTAQTLQLAIYEDAKTQFRKVYTMRPNDDGLFEFTMYGDCDGLYYTFIVNGEHEVTDPYCKASSPNSERSVVVDLSTTDPSGYLKHKETYKNSIKPIDSIICELHVRDFSISESSGTSIKGKFLSFCETGTKVPFTDLSTCVDHLLELGITHVHLLPVYDYITVDEENFDPEIYNWGYDPELYDVPEGSYATAVKDPKTRIREFKMLVMALQQKGLKVVLDVVYNHTFKAKFSNFHVLAPFEYHRKTHLGEFSNGSGVGNEFYSDIKYGREFIINSLLYWQHEYNVDGFRFDLMALIDHTTIDMALARLREKDPNVLVYGEPWMGGLSTLRESERVYKGVQAGKHYALFNDNFRDGIKGDNDGFSAGYVQQNLSCIHPTIVGIAGSIQYSEHIKGFTKEPDETINYFNSHDNLILQDKLMKSTGGNESLVTALTKMCFSIILTSQGIPFFHLGNEFARHKRGHHNTYNAPDSINAIDWTLKKKNIDLFKFVKSLIWLRRNREEFRISSAEEIRQRLVFLKSNHSDLVISYSIASKDARSYTIVVHNPTVNQHRIDVEEIKKTILESRSKTKINQIFGTNGMVVESPHDSKYIITPPISTSIHILHIMD